MILSMVQRTRKITQVENKRDVVIKYLSKSLQLIWMMNWFLDNYFEDDITVDSPLRYILHGKLLNYNIWRYRDLFGCRV